METLKLKTERFCDVYNIRQKSELKLCIVEDANEIAALYATYNGPVEFLYIPPIEEIIENLNNPDCVYVGLRYNGELVGVTKLAKLELPSSFFNPPKAEPNGDYYGVSGLMVLETSRGLRIAKRLVKCSAFLAKNIGGVGIYADFDYRNVNSMRVVSKLFNFVGFADGRHGAEGEQTIYTTFYLPLTHKLNRTNNLKIESEYNCESASNALLNSMNELGNYSVTKVAYGGEGRYNLLYCLDEVHPIKSFEIEEIENTL